MAIEQSTSVIRGQIRDFIREVADTKGVNLFTDQEPLMESGIVDSLSIFRLVSFLEETFRIRIGDEEITNENLQSVETIEQFVLSKQRR
jgi:acyl carrier protein